jgi:hypothetical protein
MEAVVASDGEGKYQQRWRSKERRRPLLLLLVCVRVVG